MEWFRWYSGTVSDPKWQLVAADSGQPVGFVLAVWAHVLERANAGNGTMEGWNARVVAVSIGATADAVTAIIDAMQGLVLDGTAVCKWSERQPKRRDDDSAERVRAHRANKRAGNDVTEGVTQCNAPQRTETLEEKRGEEKREEEEKTECVDREETRKRASRIPEGAVLPDDWRAFAISEGHPDPEREWAKFTDYWRAQPGAKGTKLDWLGTWRNWIRRSVDDGKQSKPVGGQGAGQRRSGGGSAHEALFAGGAEVAAQFRKKGTDR